ncbi:MAG: N-acetyl-gamma-glutamyl-phosphate reductase [Sandaracinaceae bacterium]|nr:N-acetyl-gamma-glutamyl-phosphate reductase [Sandaracinaceae bacterium]
MCASPASGALRAAVVGATGYTGAELVRLLHGHPRLALEGLYAHSSAGQAIGEALPSLTGHAGVVRAFEGDVDADLVFCALPHGASAPIVAALRDAGRVVLDLSADFRLTDATVYREWYGDHGAPGHFGSAVYGLPELHREAIRGADLIAVPGCYPTASILALAPLIAAGAIDLSRPLVVDAKSGVSGAGRKVRESTHFPETSEGLRAYSVAGRHRHTPEIEQELTRLAGQAVRVVFSPHLVPMTRGILSTVYLEPSQDPAGFTELARRFYDGSPSVRVLEAGSHPDTLWVRGSNAALVSYTHDRRTGVVVAQCVIDNLVKGASGQAIQCANLRFGLPEAAGIDHPAAWP